MSEELRRFGIRCAVFRDIPDVVNRRKKIKTFVSRAFVISDHADFESAMVELEEQARKLGFTEKEFIRSYDYDFDIPFKDVD